MTNTLSARQAWLDWLRTAAILGVLLFHAAQPFAEGEHWHIQNTERSGLLREFGFWLSRFRMPLLFLISGAVNYYMLLKYSGRYFIVQRWKRLMVPLLFGMLVIVPPQVYLERVSQGYTGSFWQFYPSVLTGSPYPAGNTSWHHLWFIVYLFVYDLISVPLFKWLLFGRGKRFVERQLGWLAHGRRIYLMMLPAMAGYAALVLRFPAKNNLVDDWAMLLYWYWFVIGGYLIMCNPKLVDSLVRNRRFSMLLAFLSLVFVNYFRWNGLKLSDMLSGSSLQQPLTYLYRCVYPLIAWSWVFMLLGYAKKYLDRPHRLLRQLNPALYPFYILHQTVIVILAFYVVGTKDSIMTKYGFICIATPGICTALYLLFIRPCNIMRRYFGMKPLPGKEVADKTAAEKTDIVAMG